ncbi:homoserine dehydrogenase [Buchananella hordeovulneris]|uniref:homoserine dehydrogenase n=1 Tax=Buchananella hordeovulneris TaxID=52770 RepID=UPI0026DB69AE|nr:homoserine dehydrogenase [Buchananella hordeovulneris]MDO5081064.1 homoserine dehydrogenase [Buchananella hordeovulneris]
MPEVSLAVLGAGTVGTQVLRLLGQRADDLAARAGAQLVVKAVAVRNLATPRPDFIDPALLTTDARAAMAGVDIVVELIGGIEPARSLVLAALAQGSTVVTGNKALLAAHGPELYEAAAASGADLYYEAAVAGAVPVVYAIRESLAGDRITKILGIVNGTTNYILDEMTTKGLDFQEALATAQQLGYAEADPTADVDGHDAAAKAAILSSLAFHTRVASKDVPVTGIRHITAADIAQARADGYVIKLLASAERHADGYDVRVEPRLVPLVHPLASVSGAFNAVVVESEAAGRLMFYGQGAGGAPTASAVLGDVVAAASHKVRGGNAPAELAYADLAALPPSRVRARRCLTIELCDQPGQLAAVANILAGHDISIDRVHQRPLAAQEGQPRAAVTIMTKAATRAALDAAVTELGSLAVRIINVLTVEGND